MNDCMIYTGFLNHDGYAYSNGKQVVRKLWKKHFGPIPNGLSLAHICDVRACINLAHVYLATHAENMRDKYLHKGFSQPQLSKGYRDYYLNHRHAISEQHKRYYAKNREAILKKAREKYSRGRC